MPYETKIRTGNPFGRWTKHRATLASLSRSGARNPDAEAEARQLLRAARLADAILAVRDELTDEHRARLLAILGERPNG